jgi:hypothetical protein
MIDKVFPQHLREVAQSLYQDPRITTDNGKGDPGKIVEISQE